MSCKAVLQQITLNSKPSLNSQNRGNVCQSLPPPKSLKKSSHSTPSPLGCEGPRFNSCLGGAQTGAGGGGGGQHISVIIFCCTVEKAHNEWNLETCNDQMKRKFRKGTVEGFIQKVFSVNNCFP
jgi:hypothetical protein